MEKVSPILSFSGQATLENVASQVSINFVEPEFFELSGIKPVGTSFEKQKQAIVNSSFLSIFNLDLQKAKGKSLKIEILVPEEEEIKTVALPESFEIVGSFAEEEEPKIYLLLEELPFAPKEFHLAKVKVKSEKFLEPVRAKLMGMGFMVSAISDVVSQANKIFKVLQVILATFGVVALVVAAIGLLNTMTITLLERTQEIGIVKAIGASAEDVKWLFLLESLFVGLMGGVLGIFVGFFGMFVFNSLVNLLAKALGAKALSLFFTPSWLLVFIVALSLAVSAVSGIFPTRRAQRMNPLEALRYK